MRLHWPAAARPDHASLHAKVLVIDGRSAMIGSANITGAALARNLECGLVVRCGPVPVSIAAHVRRLVRLGVLQRLMERRSQKIMTSPAVPLRGSFQAIGMSSKAVARSAPGRRSAACSAMGRRNASGAAIAPPSAAR